MRPWAGEWRRGSAGAVAAFGALADYLEADYLPSAGEEDGVGEERYGRLARRFLGSSPDLRATYDWGWAEVDRLLRRMRETAEAISPGASLAEVLQLLQEDPARAAASPAEFRDLMQERQATALAELEGVHFDVPEPIRRVDVKLAPPGGALGAFYVGPSEDFSPAGDGVVRHRRAAGDPAVRPGLHGLPRGLPRPSPAERHPAGLGGPAEPLPEAAGVVPGERGGLGALRRGPHGGARLPGEARLPHGEAGLRDPAGLPGGHRHRLPPGPASSPAASRSTRGRSGPSTPGWRCSSTTPPRAPTWPAPR